MIDLYLRAASEADMIAALSFARGTDQDGNAVWITGTMDYALSIIGPVVTTPGEYDEDGTEISPPILDTRFHANLRCTPAIAETVPVEVQIAPAPETPVRVWL